MSITDDSTGRKMTAGCFWRGSEEIEPPRGSLLLAEAVRRRIGKKSFSCTLAAKKPWRILNLLGCDLNYSLRLLWDSTACVVPKYQDMGVWGEVVVHEGCWGSGRNVFKKVPLLRADQSGQMRSHTLQGKHWISQRQLTAGSMHLLFSLLRHTFLKVKDCCFF